ncbi:MAG: hypothetical protein P4L90_10830 [Rhodopila sp.]|nr:hypothetical protein [Rhodopila sp.]
MKILLAASIAVFALAAWAPAQLPNGEPPALLATGGVYVGTGQQVADGGDYVGISQQVADGGDYVGISQQVADGGDYVGNSASA